MEIKLVIFASSQVSETINPDHFRKLERMYSHARINQFYNPGILVSEGYAEIWLTIRPDFHHAASAVHGSVYFKAMDDAAFFASNSLVKEFFVLTVSFTVYFLRPISQGEMRAFGRVVHRSNRLLVADAVLTDQDGCEIGRGNGTFMPSHIPLSPEVGYI
jgi:uncharacterized protein (TIGR00369 family)